MIGTGNNKVARRHVAQRPEPVTQLPRRGRLAQGPAPSAAWYRPAVIVLLLFTALLYLWDLSSSGNANSFYAAAVQAGSLSWKAWFFGALDKSSFITVDKPPGALWVMGLSARLFGYSSWSLLVPQALEGVAAVGLLAAAVRRVAGAGRRADRGPGAGADPGRGADLPVRQPRRAAGAAARAGRLLRDPGPGGRADPVAGGGRDRGGLRVPDQERPGAAPGSGSGPGLPGRGASAATPAGGTASRRTGRDGGGGRVVDRGGGAVARRATGRTSAGAPTTTRWSWRSATTAWAPVRRRGQRGRRRRPRRSGRRGGREHRVRRRDRAGPAVPGEFGLEISWLLPAALLLLGIGVWLTWGRARTDRARAALLVWGGWLLVTAVTFSYMKGTIHPYYTVALAPAIAALVGIGGRLLWERRRDLGRAAYAALAVVVLVTCAWGVDLLRSQSSFHPSVAGRGASGRPARRGGSGGRGGTAAGAWSGRGGGRARDGAGAGGAGRCLGAGHGRDAAQWEHSDRRGQQRLSWLRSWRPTGRRRSARGGR